MKIKGATYKIEKKVMLFNIENNDEFFQNNTSNFLEIAKESKTPMENQIKNFHQNDEQKTKISINSISHYSIKINGISYYSDTNLLDGMKSLKENFNIESLKKCLNNAVEETKISNLTKYVALFKKSFQNEQLDDSIEILEKCILPTMKKGDEKALNEKNYKNIAILIYQSIPQKIKSILDKIYEKNNKKNKNSLSYLLKILNNINKYDISIKKQKTENTNKEIENTNKEISNIREKIRKTNTYIICFKHYMKINNIKEVIRTLENIISIVKNGTQNAIPSKDYLTIVDKIYDSIPKIIKNQLNCKKKKSLRLLLKNFKKIQKNKDVHKKIEPKSLQF